MRNKELDPWIGTISFNLPWLTKVSLVQGSRVGGI